MQFFSPLIIIFFYRYRSMLGALDVPVNCWSVCPNSLQWTIASSQDTAVDAYLCHTISVPQQLQSVLAEVALQHPLVFFLDRFAAMVFILF